MFEKAQGPGNRGSLPKGNAGGDHMFDDRRVFGQAIAVSLLTVVLTQSAALAQISDAQVAQRLSGGASRKWVLTKVVGFMGPGTRCTSGETYTFFANGTVRHDLCASGSMGETALTWHVLSQANDENVVEMGGKRYEVRFREDSQTVYARLRTVVIKGVQVHDFILQFPKPEI
jgi:hypothetical protein